MATGDGPKPGQRANKRSEIGEADGGSFTIVPQLCLGHKIVR
jgi:hypothetical protein